MRHSRSGRNQDHELLPARHNFVWRASEVVEPFAGPSRRVTCGVTKKKYRLCDFVVDEFQGERARTCSLARKNEPRWRLEAPPTALRACRRLRSSSRL